MNIFKIIKFYFLDHFKDFKEILWLDEEYCVKIITENLTISLYDEGIDLTKPDRIKNVDIGSIAEGGALAHFFSKNTARKMKFSIKDFFSKCTQIRRKLLI